MLNRDGSQNRLVQDHHLGPAIMKKKVQQNVAYKEWNMGPQQVAQSGQKERPTPMKGNNSRPDFRASGA